MARPTKVGKKTGSRKRARALVPTRGPMPSIGGGFVVREPFTGAWQRNIEQRGSSALAFSAVYGCVNVISSDCGKLPMEVYREEDNGGRTLLPKHPASLLFWKPNEYQTWLDHIQQMMASVLLAGNAYALLERDQRGVVNAMHPLNPSFVQPLVNDADGSVFYQLTKSPATPLLGPLTQDSLSDDLWVVPARAMFHHRVMCVDHPLVGVTPLFAAGAAAMIGANATSGASEFLSKLPRPAGVLTSPGKIDPVLAAKLKKDWAENYSGINAGMPAVLGGGLEWKPLTVSAVDMQVIELLRFSVEDVGRVYRVPPFMLGELGKASYRNSEQMMRAYYSGCLSYHLTSLETRYDRTLELAGDVYCKFNLNELLRSEMDVRFDSYQKALASGWIKINEVRKLEGYAKVKGGDEPLVQIQYVPLSVATAAPEPEPPAPPPGDTPPEGPPQAAPDGGGVPVPPEPEKSAPAPDLAALPGLSEGVAAAPVGEPGESGSAAALPVAEHRGIWDVEAVYARGVLVTHDGSTWIAKTDSTGVKPGSDAIAWQLIVKRGADGKAGLGFNWRGDWHIGTKYHKNDVVRAGDAVWIATRATESVPGERHGWSLMMRSAA